MNLRKITLNALLFPFPFLSEVLSHLSLFLLPFSIGEEACIDKRILLPFRFLLSVFIIFVIYAIAILFFFHLIGFLVPVGFFVSIIFVLNRFLLSFWFYYFFLFLFIIRLKR